MCALMLTILLCSVFYFNLLLLGDFFFVYFMAFITSVSLRHIKNQIVHSLEEALVNSFSQTRVSWLAFICSEAYFFLKNKSLIQSIQRITDLVNETLERRSFQKKTFFNDGWTILATLVSYLTLTLLGSKSLLKLALLFVLIEFGVKLSIDIISWVLKNSGLTNALILTEQGKLRRSFHSLIAATLVLVYIVVCTAIFTLFFVMIALDIKKLQQASLGLFKLDRVAGFVDLGQFEKTFFEQFQNSFDLLENQFNITVPSHVKSQYSNTTELSDMFKTTVNLISSVN